MQSITVAHGYIGYRALQNRTWIQRYDFAIFESSSVLSRPSLQSVSTSLSVMCIGYLLYHRAIIAQMSL